MKIKITKGGIYGAKGEIEIGTILNVKELPDAWKTRCEIISGNPEDDHVELTGEDDAELIDLKAQADGLGLKYRKNVSKEKLKEDIDAKLAE